MDVLKKSPVERRYFTELMDRGEGGIRYGGKTGLRSLRINTVYPSSNRIRNDVT